jgi:toxin CptA
MHAAPSVSYPVGRSAFAGALLAGLALLGLAAACGWALQASAVGWRQGLAFVAVAACGAFALLAWLRSPAGTLRWNGQDWQWRQGEVSRDGRVEVSLDLQARLLVRWTGEGRSARWLWLERKSAPSHWEALRRAVYSRATTPVPPAGQPPAAEQ